MFSCKKAGFSLLFLFLMFTLSGCGLSDKITSNDNSEIQTVILPVEESLPTSSEELPIPVRVDEVKDGIYTNYVHGFRFEYPEDIFVNYGGSFKGSAYWDSKVGSGIPFDLGDDGVWMSVIVREKDDPSYAPTEDLFNELLSNGEYKGVKMNLINVSIHENEEYVLITSDFSNSADYEGERGYSLEARWKKPDVPVIKFSISTVKEENLSKYRLVFDTIVDSFEFI